VNTFYRFVAAAMYAAPWLMLAIYMPLVAR